MRSITAALLGLAVALPIGIATAPAHADNNDFGSRVQHFFNGFGDRDNGGRYQRNDENAQRYGWNENGDEGWRGEPRGPAMNRDRDRWRQPEEQYGYNNGYDHRSDNNGWRSDNRWRGNDNSYRSDRSDHWRGDND